MLEPWKKDEGSAFRARTLKSYPLVGKPVRSKPGVVVDPLKVTTSL